MNKVTLNKGEVVFGKWKNKDKNAVLKRVYTDPEIMQIKDKDLRKELISSMVDEWIVAYSVFRGEGFLKRATVEETYKATQELDIDDALKLGKAFNQFVETELAELKKNVNTSQTR